MSRADTIGLIARSSTVGVIGSSGFLFAPFVVGGLADGYGLTSAQAGLVVGIEMAGATAAACIVAFSTTVARLRHLPMLCLSIIAIASAVSAAAHDLTELSVLRFVVGLGEGGAIADAYARLGGTPIPDRSFAILLAACLLTGAAGLYLLPWAIALWSISALFISIAAIAAVAAFFMHTNESRSGVASTPMRRGDRDFPLQQIAIASIAVFAFFATQGAVWAFAERLGRAAGIDGASIGAALALANFAGLGAALLVAVIGSRLGSVAPLAIGGTLATVAVAVLVNVKNALSYAALICALQFLWCWCVPYFLGTLSRLITEQRLMAIGVMSQLTGLAVGPLAAAVVLDSGHTYSSVVQLCVVASAVSVGLGVACAAHVHQLSRE